MRLWLSLLSAILFAPGLFADVPVLPGENATLGRRLDDLIRREKLARDGQTNLWAEILNEYHTLLASHGEELLPLSPNHVLQVRRACAARLAQLPTEILKQHCRRIEGATRDRLEEGKRLRQAAPLRRIVDESFCSTASADALLLLGDLAFERGDYSEAELWWRILASPLDEKSKPSDGPRLRHPAGENLQAAARARQLLARWFRGEFHHPVAWHRDLVRFQRHHADAEGHLAGRRGVLWKRLQEISSRTDETRDAGSDDWPTYTGSPTRNRHTHSETLTSEGLARLRRDGNSLTLPLSDEGAREPAGKVNRPGDHARSLAFLPVVVAGHVLYCDARHVHAIDLKSGKRESWLDSAKILAGSMPDLKLPSPPDLRYTLTVASDCVLARLGAVSIHRDREEKNQARDDTSCLVCLNLKPDSQGDRLRWKAIPDGKTARVHFEGSPVVANGMVYIALTRLEENSTATEIHCYSLESRGLVTPRWKREVCRTRELTTGDERMRHHLLTVAGPSLVYCSHSGAIVALDGATGQITWGVRYRKTQVAQDPTRSKPRDLNPCIYSDGRILVAPADSDTILCLDTMTGHVLWERPNLEVFHLLGIGHGKVIFTTQTPKPGLRAIHLADGTDAWFRSGATGPVHSFGRGFLTSDLVLWPTLHHIYVVRQEDGESPDAPTLTRQLPPGNLAFGCGTLVVTDRFQMHVFTPPRLQLDERRKESERQPSSALARYRLGLALADAGRHEEATLAFRSASLRKTDILRELSASEEHRSLLIAAQSLVRSQNAERANSLLDRAASAEFPPALRRQALAQATRLGHESGQVKRAVNCCVSLLNDPTLTGGHLLDEMARPQTVQHWAVDWIDRLVQENGLAAESTLDRAVRLRDDTISDLARLANFLPQAPAVRSRLPGLARHHEQSRRPGAAADIHRLILRLPARKGTGNDPSREQARQNLARLYRDQDCDDTPLPSLVLPLERGWHLSARGGERALLAGSRTDRVFTSRNGSLICRDLANGTELWSRTPPSPPTWIERHADLVLVGSSTTVVCLTLSEGRLLWEYTPPSTRPRRNPLSGFQAFGGRLFFLQGTERLYCLDAETGKVLWTRRASGSFLQAPDRPVALTPSFQAGTRVVLAPDLGSVLNAADGKNLRPLPQVPRGLVIGRNPVTGGEHWRHLLANPTTLCGEAIQQISIGDNSALLVVPRNHGTTVERIENGLSVWANPVLLPTEPLPASAISLDASRFFLSYERTMQARRLSDGGVLWSRSLPGDHERWRTIRHRELLVAWPVERRSLSFPVPLSFGRLEWKLFRSCSDLFPVLIMEAATGQLIQKVNLPTRLPRMTFQRKEEEADVRLTRSGILIATSDGVHVLRAVSSRQQNER